MRIRWMLILFLILPLAARATVDSQGNSVSFSCTGSTGPYPFTFPISDPTALTVTQDGTALASTSYTVKPVNNNYANGGSVTLNTACPASSTLVLKRNTPLTQTSVFTDNMPIPYKTFERSLDKLTEITQELQVADWTASLGKQGTDNNLLTSGAISGIYANLCTDANGGATTSGCTGGGGSGGSPPGGSNTQVQFNDSGVFNGTSSLTYNKTTGELGFTGPYLRFPSNPSPAYIYGDPFFTGTPYFSADPVFQGNPVFLGAPLFSGTVSFTNNNSHSGTETFTNAGVFTNTQQNESLSSSVGGCSVPALFYISQGNRATDAFASCLQIPVTATIYQANAVDAMIANYSAAVNAVGLYSFAAQYANNGYSWAMNPAVAAMPGVTGSTIIGIEDDIDIDTGSTGTSAFGITIPGNFLATPAIAYGVTVEKPGGALGALWNVAYATEPGCCSSALLAAPAALGFPQSSQPISFTSSHTAQGDTSAFLFLNSLGTLISSAPAGLGFYNPATSFYGIFTNANTANRTYTMPDASGTVALNPPGATGTDLGSAALPFANLWLGTAATNNFKFHPTSIGQATTVTISDPGLSAVSLPLFTGTWATGQCAVATGTTNVFNLSVCGTPSFSGLTTGVNNSGQTLTVGATSTLTYSGSGVINARQVNGVDFNSATGCNSSTYLRGDGTCNTPAGAGNVSTSTGAQYGIPTYTAATVIGIIAPATTDYSLISNGATSYATFRQVPLATGVTGTLPNANLANPATTVNSQTCTLGSSCTIPFQTVSVNNTSQAGINEVASTVNSVGLTDTPINTGTNVVEHRITGSSYLGNAATTSKMSTTGADTTFWGVSGTTQGWYSPSVSLAFPLTVSGTVTSGGIPYFNSSVQESSSAVLPSGDFILGGGAGNPPTATFSVVPTANGGTGTASPTAHYVMVAEGASAMTPISPTANSGYVFTSNGLSADPTFQVNSALTNPMTVIGQMIGGGTSGVPVAIAVGLTGQTIVATNGAMPAFGSPGLAAGNGGSPLTTTPYTILCDSATAQRDRYTLLTIKSGASVVNVPDPTTTGCSGNFTFAVLLDGSGTVTFNRATTAVFNISNGTTNSDSQTSFTMGNGQYATFNSPDNANWTVRVMAPAGVTSVATTSPISGGTITTTGTISCPTCTTGPGSSTANDVVAWNSTTGVPLIDTSILYTNLVTAASAYTSGDLVQAAAANKTTSDSGIATANVVTAAANYTSGDLVQAAGANKSTSDSGIVTGNVVTAASNFTTAQVVQAGGANKTLVSATGHGVILPLACSDTSSSATTYTCATVPTFTPAAGDAVMFYAINQNNSGASTLNVNSVGSKPIKKWQSSTALSSGDLQASAAVVMRYDGTNWELDTQGNAPTGSGTVNNCTTAGGVAYYTSTGTAVSCLASVVESANTLTLGVAGSSIGNLSFQNATSGTLTLAPPTGALGTVTVTIPDVATTLIGESTTDTTVTHVLHASANANVGTFSAIAIADLPFSTATIGTVPNATSGSAASWTAQVTLGQNNGPAGWVAMYPAAGNFTTTWGSAATASNTILGFATVPTTGHLIDCTVTSTTCLLHDSGVVTANVVNASSPGVGIAHFAGSTQTVTSSLIVAADITNNTITGSQLAASLALTTPSLGAATATSLLATGIVDGKVPVSPTTVTSCTLGTVSGCNATAYDSGYTFNQYATAATEVTYTLPTAAVGLQFCVANDIVSGTGAADTGILRVNTSAAGQYLDYGGTRGTTGGYIRSGGAAGDAACFVGKSTTAWYVYVQKGTWTQDSGG